MEKRKIAPATKTPCYPAILQKYLLRKRTAKVYWNFLFHLVRYEEIGHLDIFSKSCPTRDVSRLNPEYARTIPPIRFLFCPPHSFCAVLPNAPNRDSCRTRNSFSQAIHISDPNCFLKISIFGTMQCPPTLLLGGYKIGRITLPFFNFLYPLLYVELNFVITLSKSQKRFLHK